MNFTDDNGVIQAFMDQQQAKSKTMKTDGQSLFSFDIRIAEHIPSNDGGASTLVYDYTYGGGAYVSGTTSNHVRLTKKFVPKQNWVSVAEAQEVGLCPELEVQNETNTGNSR
jgi:hypothetical protein